MALSLELIGIFFYIGISLYVAIVVLALIFGNKFLRLSKKNSENVMGRFFLFIFLFFILVAIAYSMRIYFVFLLPSDMEMFYHELIYRDLQITKELAKFHAVFTYSGFGMLSASVEYSIYKKKTKYILSISLIASFIIILVLLPYDVAIFYQIIPISFGAITVGLLIFTYIYMGIKHPGELRKKSFTVALGLVLLIMGVVLNNYGFLQNSPADVRFIRYTLIAPIFLIIGIFVLHNGYKERD